VCRYLHSFSGAGLLATATLTSVQFKARRLGAIASFHQQALIGKRTVHQVPWKVVLSDDPMRRTLRREMSVAAATARRAILAARRTWISCRLMASIDRPNFPEMEGSADAVIQEI
jgi:hypothetical protein